MKSNDDSTPVTVLETAASPVGTVEELVNRYLHCQICGSKLHVKHLTDFAHNLTQEIAKCPECGISARNLIHRLQ